MYSLANTSLFAKLVTNVIIEWQKLKLGRDLWVPEEIQQVTNKKKKSSKKRDGRNVSLKTPRP
jgi:predicted RNA-binding protein YlxR (DUF448 family)